MSPLPEVMNARRASRRLKFGARSAGLVLGALVIAVLLNVLATRFVARFDVTATGEQRLAARTIKTLESLEAPFRIVIAAPLGAIDRRARERVTDVLREMSRESAASKGGRVMTTFIDTSAASGLSEYKNLIREIAARDEATLKQQSAAVELTNGGITALNTYLVETLSPAMLSIREAISPDSAGGQQNRLFLEQAAAAARLNAQSLRQLAAKVTDALRTRVDDIPVPQTDVAATVLIEGLTPVAEQLGLLAAELKKVADGKSNPALAQASDAAKPLVREVETRRDQINVLLEPLRRFKRPDILRINEVLKRGSAALIIGPPEVGLGAIDLESLFPSQEWLKAAQLSNADLGRRAEELISTSLAAVSGRAKPIVVFLHAEPREIFGTAPLVVELTRKLGMRGIDTVEWSCTLDADPKGLPQLNPEKKRPVVYVSIAPDSSASAGARGEPSGVQKAEKLGSTLRALIDRGENVMVSLNPSILPGAGSPDPIAAALARFGLGAATGKPLMRERFSPQGGRLASVELTVQARGMETEGATTAVDHVILGAVRGLPTYFPWPIALTRVKPASEEDPASRSVVTALYAAGQEDSLWGETQWLRLWQTRAEERSLSPDQPVFDASRDARGPEDPAGGGREWVLAAAAQLPRSSAAPQRLIVVGSNGWFFDGATQRGARIDGRLVPLNPGNSELFDSSVSWLAGQDDLIAQSPSARTLPVIQPIDERSLLMLRFAIIGGLPMLILAIGAVYRLVRG